MLWTPGKDSWGSIFHVLFATAQMEVLTLPLHQFLSIQDIKCVQRTFQVKGTKCCHTNRNAAYPASSRLQNAEFKHTQSIFALPSWCVWFLFLHLCSFWHLIYPDIQLNGRKGEERHSTAPTPPLSLAARMYHMEETISCLNLGKRTILFTCVLSLTSTITAFSPEWKLSQHQMHMQRLNRDQSSLPLNYNPGIPGFGGNSTKSKMNFKWFWMAFPIHIWLIHPSSKEHSFSFSPSPFSVLPLPHLSVSHTQLLFKPMQEIYFSIIQLPCFLLLWKQHIRDNNKRKLSDSVILIMRGQGHWEKEGQSMAGSIECSAI